MRVAVFDFDGTVYKYETFKVLMKHLKEHSEFGKRYNRFFRAMLLDYLSYKVKISPENKMKERSMQHYLSAFQNSPLDKVHHFFKGVAIELTKDFNTEVVKRLDWHKKNGDLVMLVSGSYTKLLEEIINEGRLPFNFIIGTEIPSQNDQVDNIHTMRHIQGKRKIKEIKRVLREKQVDWQNSYAYGDSYSDLPMLELVGHPVAVQPEKKLKAIATYHNWEII